MGLTPTIKESLTQAFTQDVSYANAAVWLSLHSANPGTSGTSEVTSGLGAAGRQQVTFTGSGGTDTNTASVSVSLTAATVTWIGFWTAHTGGTFLGGFPLVSNGTMLTAVSGSSNLICPAHGLVVNDPVRLFAMPGPALSAVPATFAADTLYYVKSSADADHLVLAATMGGTAIVPSSSASCGMYSDESQITVTGTLTFPGSTGISYITAS